MPPNKLRPCGAPGCYLMQRRCTSDQECAEGAACLEPQPDALGGPAPTPSQRFCDAKPCQTDGDCGSPNLSCREGQCTHRTCRADDECDGYCVGGQCWTKLGWCHDPRHAPPSASGPGPGPAPSSGAGITPIQNARPTLSALMARDPRSDSRCAAPFVSYWTWPGAGSSGDPKELTPFIWLAPAEAPNTPVVAASHPRATLARCIAVGPHRGLNLANWCCRAEPSASTVAPPQGAKGLVATLAVERSVVAHQRDLVVAVAIENRGPTPQKLLRTAVHSAVLLLEVRDAAGKVMPPLPPPTPPPTPDWIRLPPGGGHVLQHPLDVFAPPLPAGTYTVRVRDGQITSGALEFRIASGG